MGKTMGTTSNRMVRHRACASAFRRTDQHNVAAENLCLLRGHCSARMTSTPTTPCRTCSYSQTPKSSPNYPVSDPSPAPCTRSPRSSRWKSPRPSGSKNTCRPSASSSACFSSKSLSRVRLRARARARARPSAFVNSHCRGLVLPNNARPPVRSLATDPQPARLPHVPRHDLACALDVLARVQMLVRAPRRQNVDQVRGRERGD